MRLYDSDDKTLLMENDDGDERECGLCSSINFTVGNSISDSETKICQEFKLYHGCYGNTLCSGLTVVTGLIEEIRSLLVRMHHHLKER
jgi:hypothetical protein